MFDRIMQLIFLVLSTVYLTITVFSYWSGSDWYWTGFMTISMLCGYIATRRHANGDQ